MRFTTLPAALFQANDSQPVGRVFAGPATAHMGERVVAGSVAVASARWTRWSLGRQ